MYITSNITCTTGVCRHKLYKFNKILQPPKENISQPPFTEICDTSALQEPHK